ncbi:WSC-domain-containing protein [Mycena sanguinolenta]|nr:WSC-domain-containing protein [Mycena sanguinolenta]
MPAYRLAIIFALAQLGLALTVSLTLQPGSSSLNKETRAPAQFSSTKNGNQSNAKGWCRLSWLYSLSERVPRDSTSGRALHHLVAVSSPNMTVESCLDACAAGGFILGGVEFGEECYCGNALLYEYGSSEACDMPCSGNASEFCGGPDALNLYQFADTPFTTGPPSPVFRYKNWGLWACINEGPSLFPHGPLISIPAEQMTVDRCLDGCEAAGYNVAGLQDGQNCYCNLVETGGEGPNSWESTSGCFEPCLGNATQTCGGLVENGSLVEGQLSGYITCNPPNTAICSF